MTDLFWNTGEFLSPALLIVCVVAFFATAILVVILTDKNPGKCK